MSVTLVLLAALVSLVVVLVGLLYSKMPSPRVRALVDQIPGPPTIPLLGNAHKLKSGGGEFLTQVLGFASDFGTETGLLRIWIANHVVVVATKADTAEVLLKSSKHITKSFFYDFMAPWLGTGLLISTGEKWQVRRKLITPTFHFKILDDFLQVFNEQATVMQRKLGAMADSGRAFDIMPYITLCALDIICESAMGKNVSAQEQSDSEYVKALYKISELIMERIKSPWLWVDFIYFHLPTGREYSRLLQILHGFTNDVIRERAEELDRQLKAGQKTKSQTQQVDDKPSAIGGRKRLAFLDMLLYSSQDNKLSNDDIREEVDTFMFEGHDTTAAAVSWAVHLIGADPDVQDKLLHEVDEIFGESDRPVTMDDVKQLKYLECVIKESLRLYPSVPLFARQIAEDCDIRGYFVPKGATATILTSAIHRDPAHFPEPEEFRPDRWLPENAAGRHPFCFIPFSAGPRNCIGQKFAMIEEKVMLSSILRRYRITSLQARKDLVPCGELIQRSLHGIDVKLERIHCQA